MKINGAKRVIIVSSGKGGAGKSTITVLLAHALKNAGYSVGILDCDITGSSIPLLLGEVDEDTYCLTADSNIVPAKINGFQVMSMALLSTDESIPLLWESDYISHIISQTFSDIEWDVDILLFDVPPGSGIINRRIVNDVENARYVFVSISQEIVRHDVIKSINMIKYFGGDIIGMIENFAVENNDVIKKIENETGVHLIGKIPELPLTGDKIDYDSLNTEFMDDIVKAVL